MKSISFDNPYWLIIAIPLAIAILVPYFISVSKDNKNKSWIASLIIHFVIIVAIALASAGLVHTTVMTRTKVYVVADVSYSSNRNLDKIDEYIQKINSSLPQNSKLGIVCFGKDSAILTSSGTEIKSVKEAKVDDSGTDIASALEYTSTLFSEGEIKRIVLITDGTDTTYDGKLASTVDRLVKNGIKIDSVYLDNNLREGEREIQITDVEYTKATYLDHKSALRVLVESNTAESAILNLYSKADEYSEYERIDTTVLSLDNGMNIATLELPTGVSGVFDYKVEIVSEGDTSAHNNDYLFTQTVAGKRNILLITELQSDINMIKALYSESAVVDAYLVRGEKASVPYSKEDFARYDEIILSNVDIRRLEHAETFVDSLDVSVSQYGKSLITLGDLSMQNKDDEIFAKLEDILPISFGNANKDAKLYTIILDISRSMNDTSQLIIAKDAATKLLSILNDDDYVAYITLAGSSVVERTPTRLGDCREELYSQIQSAEPCQGTFIGHSMKLAYEFMEDLPFEEKQVMLISDGLTFTYESEDAVDYAKAMKNSGITVSTVNVLSGTVPQAVSLLTEIANEGGGDYYLIERAENVAEIVFASIADELTESVVEGRAEVNVKTFRDDTMDGIINIPDVFGYINSKAKLDATSVLTVDYRKNSEVTVEVPLYVYREYGNGRVSSFTSSLSGDWLREWDDGILSDFFGNVMVTNTPKENVTYPFTVNITYGGSNSTLEIIPAYLNPKANAKITITAPSGAMYEEELVFDLNKFFTLFETDEIGRYDISITYSYGNNIFTANTYFNVSRYDEYDAFKACSVGNIHSFMRGLGRISTDGSLNLESDRTEVATYELSFRLPLLVLAVALFVFDVFIRKFKPNKKAKSKKKKVKENVKNEE